MIKFTIPGEAVPQLRPRFARIGNHVRTYDPEKSRNYKAYVRLIASEYKPEQPIEGAVMLFVDAFRQPPASWSKKKLEQVRAGKLHATSKPDIDNIVKGIKDAMKGLIWRDDSQVIILRARKFFAQEARVEVAIFTIEEMEAAESQ